MKSDNPVAIGRAHTAMQTLFCMGCGLLLGAALCGPATAETAEEKGLAIIVEADKRDLGWHDNQVSMRMVLRNKQGQESTRALRQSSLEIPEKGLGDRGLVIFDSPKDVEAPRCSPIPRSSKQTISGCSCRL